eukprot:183567-Prymnesium_polylepis.2
MAPPTQKTPARRQRAPASTRAPPAPALSAPGSLRTCAWRATLDLCVAWALQRAFAGPAGSTASAGTKWKRERPCRRHMIVLSEQRLESNRCTQSSAAQTMAGLAFANRL